IRDVICAQRRKRPREGPITLLERLRVQMPGIADRLPAPSTAGDILKCASLVKARRRRRHVERAGSGPIVADSPNSVWSADFKGEFRTKDGVWCYPLTVSDALTRYLVLCKGMESTAQDGVRRAFERLFAEVGLPEAIRT